MKVQVESLSPVKKKLSISVPEEDVLHEFEHAYQRVSRQAQIPGFRPGKIPRPLLEKRFGAAVEAEVFEELVRRTVVEALKSEKLDIVAFPQITDTKRSKGDGLSYTASVEVKPAFEPQKYTGISVTKPKKEVKKEQIEEVLKKLQDGHAVLKEREGAKHPMKGDFVSLRMQETDDTGNVKNPAEESKEQLFEIGKESLHPDVEKAVMKLGVGGTAPVTVKLEDPAKEIHLNATVVAIKEKILPGLDDEFAKSVGPFENLKALTERVEKDLQSELEENSKAEMIQQILKSLLDSNPLDLPESLVDNELHSLMDNFVQQMERVGMKEMPEEYSEKNLHEKLKPDAQRRVHEQLLLEAIAAKESVVVEDKELNEKLNRMASAAKIPPQEFRSYFEKTGRIDSLRFQILAQKTLDFLLSSAKIK